MCMMGLFVILWVLKPGPRAGGQATRPDEEMIKVLASIREAFGLRAGPDEQRPGRHRTCSSQKLEQIRRRTRAPARAGRRSSSATGAEGTDPEVTNDPRRASRRPSAGGCCSRRASATLTPEATRDLDQIAD